MNLYLSLTLKGVELPRIGGYDRVDITTVIWHSSPFCPYYWTNGQRIDFPTPQLSWCADGWAIYPASRRSQALMSGDMFRFTAIPMGTVCFMAGSIRLQEDPSKLVIDDDIQLI